VLLSSQAWAASIQVVDRNAETPIVTIEGDIEQGDGKIFEQTVTNFQKAVIGLSSEGGRIGAGVYIGEVIRAKGFATVVPNGEKCSSVCGVIWLAGNPRLIGPKAHVGFHAAYDGETMEENGAANAVVGAGANNEAYAYRRRTT